MDGCGSTRCPSQRKDVPEQPTGKRSTAFPSWPRIATLVERISLDLADIETCFNEPSPSHVGGHYAKEADVMSPHPLAHFHELSVDVLGDSLRLVDTLTRSSW